MNNLNLIIGEDSKLIDFYMLKILDEITYDENNKIIYDMNNYHLSDILDEASTISLFSSVKVIIGTNIDISKISDEDINYLTSYMENINKDVYIILIASKVDSRLKSYKIFAKKFNIIDASKNDDDKGIYNYVLNKIKEKKYKISDYDIQYLIDRTGKDINDINMELTKLFLYKEDDKVINREDIDLLVVDNIDNVIYEFTNAVLSKDLEKASYMYDNFKRENVSFDYLLSSLANVFRQAIIIKILANEGKNNSEIAKVIGKKEFYVKKTLERLYEYNVDELEKIITKLAKIDLDYKSGKSNYDMLQIFILEMVK